MGLSYGGEGGGEGKRGVCGKFGGFGGVKVRVTLHKKPGTDESTKGEVLRNPSKGRRGGGGGGGWGGGGVGGGGGGCTG